MTEALARFTEESYRIQIEQLRGGEAAAYEPMQLRVLALQARTALIQARNRYFSAWNQLAATVNAPNLPPTQLAGNPNVTIPALRFDILRSVVWERHPDILAARNSTEQARINLRFEEITPIPGLIPLLDAAKGLHRRLAGGELQHSNWACPCRSSTATSAGSCRPKACWSGPSKQNARVRNDLTATLADAFERYENNRAILEYYRVSILPDQARAYRGTYERHQQQPDRVGFADVVVAQQMYATAISSYLLTLGAQWTAVTDLENVVQVEDLLDLQNIERSVVPDEVSVQVITNVSEAPSNVLPAHPPVMTEVPEANAPGQPQPQPLPQPPPAR